MSEKLKVGVLFGGRSGEHEVSLRSAASVMEAMDKAKYQVIPVGITLEGRWLAGGDPLRALRDKWIPGDSSFATLVTDPLSPGLMLLPERPGTGGADFLPLDVVFPVLHGPYGEDGTVQGLLELAGLPYVGAGVLASAAGMDKVLMKLLFKHRGLPVGDFLYFYATRWEEEKQALLTGIEEKLGFPCFVKPSNLGSSVGVNKARCPRTLEEAVEEALLYDEKVVVERFLPGREIECSVLGDQKPVSSVPGEVVPCNEFYDYRAKYIDDRSELIIPAKLEAEVEEQLKDYAVRAFQAVECSGLGRVDFFYCEEENQVYVNEINTIPGFTNISMYPKLFEASGIPYPELIDRLIQIALERHHRRQKLHIAYQP